jgi:predicted nucleic acid-binding protein
MRTFFDTNLLVTLFDAGAPKKQRIARDLLQEHTASGEILLSTQVLQEFYVAVTRKLAVPLGEEEAHEAVREFAALPLVQVDAETILAAIQLARTRRIAFWDALIVQSALRGGATTLLSEDMQAGAAFDGLRVVNPLAEHA